MTSNVQVSIDKALPSAPHERGLVPDRSASQTITVNLTASEAFIKAGVTFTLPIIDLVSESLKGVSKAWVHKFTLVYLFTAKGQSISAGISHPDNTLSHQQFSMARGGMRAFATDFNMGPRVEHDLTPMETFTLQLRPTSAELLTPKIYIKASAGVEVAFIIDIVHQGTIVYYTTLNSRS